MGLPASGPISSSQVGDYLGDSAPYKLGEMADTAGFSEPDKLSDFYSYVSQYDEFYYYDISQKGSAFACLEETNAQGYHDGTAAGQGSGVSLPKVGDHLFDSDDPASASPLNLVEGKWYAIATDSNVDAASAMLIKIGDANEVDSIQLC
tara:strand:+ start:431 stop:877 length:447 start_codon:yes stop_codon:yes gene_type:complete